MKNGFAGIAFTVICVTILLSPLIATVLMPRFAMPSRVVETFETYPNGAMPDTRWTTIFVTPPATSFTTKLLNGNKVGNFIDASTTSWPRLKCNFPTPGPKSLDIEVGVTVIINSITAEAIYIMFGDCAAGVGFDDIKRFGFVAFGTNANGMSRNFINVNDKFCAGINWAEGDVFDIKFSFVNATGIRCDLRRNGADLAPILRSTSFGNSIWTTPINALQFQNLMYGAGGMFDIDIDNICASW